MTRRSWTLALAMLTLTAVGGVWAGLGWANTRSGTKAVDCCLDPTCPPGCSEVCPPNCADTTCCCDDPTCPPGCSPACPPDCLDFTAKASTKTAAKPSRCSEGVCCAATAASSTKTSVAKKYICPPCPFCPGW